MSTIGAGRAVLNASTLSATHRARRSRPERTRGTAGARDPPPAHRRTVADCRAPRSTPAKILASLEKRVRLVDRRRRLERLDAALRRRNDRQPRSTAPTFTRSKVISRSSNPASTSATSSTATRFRTCIRRAIEPGGGSQRLGPRLPPRRGVAAERKVSQDRAGNQLATKLVGRCFRFRLGSAVVGATALTGGIVGVIVVRSRA